MVSTLAMTQVTLRRHYSPSHSYTGNPVSIYGSSIATIYAFIFTTNNFLPPAVGEAREAREVIFVLGNSKERHVEYHKISLLTSKH